MDATHAGKNQQECIDHAVMLGVSLKRHMPGDIKFALRVKEMSKAGWHVVLVADWRFPEDVYYGCNKACIDDKFMLHRQDSMERLPTGCVLNLDQTRMLRAAS